MCKFNLLPDTSSEITAFYYLLYQVKTKKLVSNNYTFSNSDLQIYSADLQNLYNNFKHIEKKKPITAAFLSTVVPGLGKAYAGRYTEAILPFLKCVISGFIAYEGFKHGDFKSATFYAFGSYGLINYVSTIYGSYKTVKTIQYDESVWLNNKVDEYYKRSTIPFIDK